jgi:HEAT repeat protein
MKLIISLFLILAAATALHAGSPEEKNIREALTKGSKQEFNEAVDFIEKRKPEKYIPLITEIILKSENTRRRERLLGALKKYDKTKTIDYWLEILEKTGSLEIKSEILQTIKDLKSRKITASLIRLLSSRFITIRKKAASALKKFSDDRMYLTILQLSESSNPLHRVYAIDALIQLYDKRLYPAVLELLKDKNKSIRIYTLNCILSNRLTEALPFVRKTAAADSNGEVVIEAIRTIKGLNDRKSHFILNQLVMHRDSRIRKESIIAIKELNLKNSSVHLSIQLQKENRDENIEEIIEALIRFRNTGNITGLKNSSLSHKNFRIRVKAVHALGIINNDSTINILIKAATDPDYRVRAEACHSLGMFRSRNVLIPLLQLLKNEKTRYVKTAALYSIHRLNDKKALLPLFKIYSDVKDPVFRKILEEVISGYIEKYI